VAENVIRRGKIKHMRRIVFSLGAIVVWALLASSAFCADEPAMSPPTTCSSGIPGGVNCVPTKKELKEARAAFARGMKLQQSNQLQEAFARYDDALHLAPQNPQFLRARELVKAQLVFNHIERGNALLGDAPLTGSQQDQARRTLAAAEFRAALDLDPDNEFARERLQESAADPGFHEAIMPEPLAYAGEIHLQPKSDHKSFQFRGDVRGLFTELGTDYGVTVTFDDSVTARKVRFYVEDVDFFTALRLACQVSKTMWAALDAHQLFIASDTKENHTQFDRMSLQTFVLPPHSTPQEATDMQTALRNIFELKFISAGQTAGILEVRAPQPILAACTKLMAQLNGERPQVMLDVRVFQIDHTLAKNIGMHIPDTFNLYNIPIGALAALGGQNIQQLISQLISGGGINQAGGSSLSALLAQLMSQTNGIFSQPLATFGGGLTFEGLSLDQLAFNLSLNESWSHSLEHMTLRAGQGVDATFHVGTRYPILNASFAPIYNSPQISAVLGNQSYQAPFPSVSYEDLGLNLKAKPVIHGNGDVSMTVELQVRSLTGQSANGVPVIANREYQGSINLRDGEPAAIAGQISRSDELSMSGIPGFGLIPGLNQALVNNTRQEEDDELLIVITPHVISNFPRDRQEIWVSE
jgi:general secretion pathway protein D